MARRIVLIGGIILALALAGGLFFVFRAPEEASAPIAAIPIAQATATPAPAAPTAAPAAATPSDAATPDAAAPTAAPVAATPMLFEIAPGESQARFLIDEVLRGSPVTVRGVTDQVAGQIAIDLSNPANTQVGVIQINARTLATDNDFRNRAIKNAILDTNSFEFITFTPTAISGIPEQVAVGQPLTFQITGDLTVKDVTRSVTFDVTVTPISADQIKGVATAKILHRDFGLNIPDAPAVDTVADEVTLELEFLANITG